MAATIITEILKKIQDDLNDQKEYMRNLHVVHKNINEKFNFLEVKISHIDQKLDEQQVTMGKIKQQVYKNNALLFGTEDKIDDTVVSDKLDCYDEVQKYTLVEQADNSIEKSEANDLSTLNLSKMQGTEPNCRNDKNKNEIFTKTDDNNEDTIKKELREIKEFIISFKYHAVENPSNKEPAIGALQQMTELKEFIGNDLRQIKESIALIRDFTTEINTKIKTAADSNHITAEFGKFTNEIREIKELNISIKNFVTERITTIEGAANSYNEKASELSKSITSELHDMKDLMSSFKYITERKTSIVKSDTASEQKTVRISPAYFSADQISKLNEELKRVTDIHRESDVFPIIEVVPGSSDEHPVMKKLRNGVYYKKKDGSAGHYPVKLGMDGLKSSDIRDVLTDYPDLLLYDVVKEIFKKKDEWDDFSQEYSSSKPCPYYTGIE